MPRKLSLVCYSLAAQSLHLERKMPYMWSAPCCWLNDIEWPWSFSKNNIFVWCQVFVLCAHTSTEYLYCNTGFYVTSSEYCTHIMPKHNLLNYSTVQYNTVLHYHFVGVFSGVLRVRDIHCTLYTVQCNSSGSNPDTTVSTGIGRLVSRGDEQRSNCSDCALSTDEADSGCVARASERVQLTTRASVLTT